MREWLKAAARAAATVAILPQLASFKVRAALMGGNRALTGSSQVLSLIPDSPASAPSPRLSRTSPSRRLRRVGGDRVRDALFPDRRQD
jgi:hypothetical protein